jgi:hypothetical protein
MGAVSCGFDSNANTVLNSSVTSDFVTDCDSFAPGDCGGGNSNVETTIAVVVAATEETVFSSFQSCSCIPQHKWVNQKYKITSSTSGEASQEEILGWPIPQDYFWTDDSVTQWCINGKLSPNAAPTTTIRYLGPDSTPSSMPGAYVNVDMEAIEYSDGTIVAAPFVGNVTNWGYGIGQGSSFIYTWNNTATSKTRSGGQPTAACTGSPQM